MISNEMTAKKQSTARLEEGQRPSAHQSRALEGRARAGQARTRGLSRGARGVRGHCKQDTHTATWPHEAAHWTQTCWDVSPGPWEGAPLGQSLSGNRHDAGCGAGVPSPLSLVQGLSQAWGFVDKWKVYMAATTRALHPGQALPLRPPRCGRPSCRHPRPVFLPLPVCASEFLASKGTSK